MATLAHASSDFVDALRQGLEAYDAGDNKKAYAIFDKALTIEPDNIWGLLWKGATAPSLAESKFWLDKAITIEPNNEHALTGLQWTEEMLTQASESSVAVIEEESIASPDEPEMAAVVPPVESVDPVEKEVSRPLNVAADVEAEAISNLLGDDEPKESLPEWLSEESVASAQATDELPDWLKEEEDTTTAQKIDVPEWLNEEVAEAASDSSDLPDWLREESGPAATESGDLPEWLRGDSEPAPASGDLPEWLNQAQAVNTPERPGTVDPDLPNWLHEDSQAAPAVVEAKSEEALHAEELPTWLVGNEESEFQAQRSKGSLSASNEVVEAYQSGLLAYEEDRLDDATIAFQRVIRLDATHVEAHNYLGSVFYLNGRPDDAIAALRRALELDPKHTESYLNLGLVYKETSNTKDAVEMFRNYLELAAETDTTAIYVRELIEELSA